VYTVWTTQPVDGNGLPLPRVRVQHPDAGTPAPPPSTGDFVFCLTCHRAHGSPNPTGLIYPDPTTPDSLCNQCHAPVTP
jgi:predicted CXXCH cytochrome family protein